MLRHRSPLTAALAAAGLLLAAGALHAAEIPALELAEKEAQAAAEHADAKFPGREIYFYVDTLELDELAEMHAADEVHIVDVRTRFEFDTLRIDGAHHVSIDDPDFVEKVVAIQEQDPELPVAFYCRGHTCFMGYQAVERMMAAGHDNAYNMDAGIFDWAENHPQVTAMFGEAPIRTAELIDFNQFRDHLLPPAEFAERAHSGEFHVLDIRRPFERDQIGLFMQHETNITASDAEQLEPFLEEVRASGKPLLVYDITGHEIKVFQYTLEQHGIEDYYFMEGGFKGFQDTVLR